MAYSPVTGANFGGGPYSGKAKPGQPIRNNGGTVMFGGNIQTNYGVSSPIGFTQSLGNAYFGYRSGSNGTVVPLNPVGGGVSKAIANGTFASMTPGVYIGMRYGGGQIAGIASTILIGGAGYSGRRSENTAVPGIRTTQYIMGGGWYWTTGQPVNRQDKTDVIPMETLPTMAIPGKLTYMVTGKTAQVDTYKAKTD